MPNYDIPPPTPSERLKNAFRDISDLGLAPVDTVSRSLDAIADAIRAHHQDPEQLLLLAEAISQSSVEVATIATIAPAPAPAKATKAKATGADTVAG